MAEDIGKISSQNLDHRESEPHEPQPEAKSAAVIVTSKEASPTPKTEEGRELTRSISIGDYWGPVGGWGSLQSVATHLQREDVPLTRDAVLWKQNKPDGFMCVSCAWAKPARPAPVRILRERRQGDRLGDHLHERIDRDSSPSTP